MPKRPIVKPRLRQISRRTGRIGVVPRRPRQGRVHHGDVHRRWHRGFELGQQAVGRIAVAETDAVYIDGVIAKLDHAALAIEHMHIGGQGDFTGDGVFRIMVALDIEDLHARLGQSLHLPGKIGGGLGAAFLTVVQVTRDQKRRDIFVDTVLHHRFQRVTAGITNLCDKPVVL